MKFRIKGIEEIFENSGDAYEYCMENELSLEDVEEIPEDWEAYCKSHPEDPECKRHKGEIHGIEESPKEENVDEDSVITTEEEQEQIGALNHLAEVWDELTVTEKRQVLSVAFGHETKHPKHFEKEPKLIEGKIDPVLKKDVGNALAEYHLSKIIKKVELGSCPFCDEHYTQDQFYEGVKLPEELSFFEPSTKPVKANPPVFEKQAKAKSPKMFTKEAKIKVTVQHIKSRHPKIYALIKDLFEKEESERRYDDTEKPDQAQHLSKENLEELSKEELTKRITADTPEGKSFRKELFHLWKKKLQNRS